MDHENSVWRREASVSVWWKPHSKIPSGVFSEDWVTSLWDSITHLVKCDFNGWRNLLMYCFSHSTVWKREDPAQSQRYHLLLSLWNENNWGNPQSGSSWCLEFTTWEAFLFMVLTCQPVFQDTKSPHHLPWAWNGVVLFSIRILNTYE